jgi:CBS domain-containing protein
MGATDPAAFLRATAPFKDLPAALFEEAARELDVVYHPPGGRIARAGGEPLAHLFVIRKGSVRIERDGQILRVLEEGETFGYTSLISRQASLDVIVDEDLVAYRLPDAAFRRLLGDARFAAHFAQRLGERLEASLEHPPVAALRADLSLTVEHLLQGPAVWVDEDADVGAAAERMRREGVSAVLVRGDPPGMVTDRDFRNRVLAEGHGPATPLRGLVGRELRTVAWGTPVYEAWSVLLDAGVRHLPVVRGGEIVGVLTSTDLLRCTAQGPMAVLRAVEQLGGRDALPGYAGRVAEMAGTLLAGGLDGVAIAGFVARLGDALVRRLVRWAESDLGPPPAPYAWLAFGSEGRMEQLLLTDQDNGLVFADAGGRDRRWYRMLAERVNADLEAAGFPPCPGGWMARRLHAPLAEWSARLAALVDAPSPAALLEAAVLLDARKVAGTLDLAPLEASLLAAGRNVPFVRFLARAALEFKPPAPMVLRLRGGASTVDLKSQALGPLAFLARCYGLEAGIADRGTVARLAGAARAGLLEEHVAQAAAGALRLLLGLRLSVQLRRGEAGEPPGSEVALADLSAVERSRLKDSLRAVKSLQERAARHFALEGA